MMTLDEVRHALKDRRPTMVARACGLHHNTVANIRDGSKPAPSYAVVKALSDYLSGGDNA
jgi:hypothetical protein